MKTCPHPDKYEGDCCDCADCPDTTCTYRCGEFCLGPATNYSCYRGQRETVTAEHYDEAAACYADMTNDAAHAIL